MRNAIDANVAETVGAGIEATSTHPDTTIRAEIDAIAQGAFATIDAEGRTDLRGRTAAAVQAVEVDGEAFFHTETHGASRRCARFPLNSSTSP